MPIKQLLALRQEIETPLLADEFDAKTIFEMELALQQACDALPDELDSYEYRRFIASKIIARVVSGERTFGAMAFTAIAAIEALRRHREFV